MAVVPSADGCRWVCRRNLGSGFDSVDLVGVDLKGVDLKVGGVEFILLWWVCGL